jgi:site-specific DNA-methyltransferase (adenine-specific)
MKRSTIRLEWEGKNTPSDRAAQPLRTILSVRPSSVSINKGLLPNRLFLGDNLQVMDSLFDRMKGKFRVIYADPPFATGKGFSRRIGRNEDSRKPKSWKLGTGYSDSWNTPEQYLTMLQTRLTRMHDLLSDDGTLYLHLDWRASHYARILLDELFGPENFLNEIIWVYHGPSPVRAYFNRKHDTILSYGKSSRRRFHADRIRIPYHPSTVRTFQSSAKAGFGKMPDLERGKVPEDWWYFPVVARLHAERTGYPTQKPEALLERMLLASSDSGDWVGDFFCGSGTTLRVAESLGRRWVGCDILPQSIGICQRRMALAKAHPYTVEVLGDDLLPVHSDTRLHLEISGQGNNVEIRLAGMTHCLPDGFPDSLDYWEIDFSFSDEVFNSHFQAARPWRNGAIETLAKHRYAKKGPHRIAVRALASDGTVGFCIREFETK